MNIDKKSFYFAGSAILVLLVSLSVQGCNLQKIVKFEVPKGVQNAIDSSDKESIQNSEYVWSQWQGWVENNSETLARNIDESKSRVAMIENIVGMGMGALGDASGSFPGGALLFSGLTMATGLFMKRPGESKVIAKEKEKSYNAGMAKGSELLQKTKGTKNA
tara:strand:+ start:219 stop:704 length:486 start_codon:yes stop_codon:yes gene_type:complete